MGVWVNPDTLVNIQKTFRGDYSRVVCNHPQKGTSLALTHSHTKENASAGPLAGRTLAKASGNSAASSPGWNLLTLTTEPRNASEALLVNKGQ